MAIAYDTGQSVSGYTVSQLTIPTFATSGENRFIFVGATCSSSAVRTVTSVVRGGSETFTEVWDWGVTDMMTSGHYYVNPATATATIVVTYSTTVDDCEAGAVALNGVDQTTAIGTYQTNNGTSTTPTVTVSPGNDDWICDCVYGGISSSQTWAAGANQTERWKYTYEASWGYAGSSTQLGSDGGVMSWTNGSASFRWVIGAVPVKPKAEADYGTPRDHTGTKPWSLVWRPGRI